MADVSRDRAQILLVTALGLAILFVTLALIVNTVIYTENLATRSSNIGGGSEAIRHIDAVREGIGGAIAYANTHNDSSKQTVYSNLTVAVSDWSDLTARVQAVNGVGTNLTLVAAVNGTRIVQEDASRNFTNRTFGSANWTVVEEVNGTRKFRINVTDETVLESAGSGDVFAVNVTDGSGYWRLNVTRDGSTEVHIRNASGISVTCAASTAQPWINVTDGTVAGEECDGLQFAEGVSTPYTVSFENGGSIVGTYTLIVDNETLADSPLPHLNSKGSGSPYATYAVYSADINVYFQTPRLFLNTTIRVAPGETDG